MSGETKVKNIEWLKDEILTDMRYLEGNREIEQLDIRYQTLREVAQKINSLDEPEVLSQEWVDEHTVYAPFDGWITDDYIHVGDLQNLIVPKQGLPVIPRFVADWIEENKKQNKSIVFAICYMYDENEIGGSPTEKENKIFQWMESSDNDEVFARAWLGGYEVEKEQKYYALVKGHELVNGSEGGYWTVDGDDFYIYNNWYDHSEYKPTKLTKYDWSNLGINEDNADFVKAGDME